MFTARYGLTVQTEFRLISDSKSSNTPQLHRFPDAVSCPRQDTNPRRPKPKLTCASRPPAMCTSAVQISLHDQGRIKGRARLVAARGANFTALRRHWYNRKYGSRKSRLPHAEEYLPGTIRNFGMRPHKRSPALS